MVILLQNTAKSQRTQPKKVNKTITLFFFGPLYSLQKKGKRIYLKLHFSFNIYFEIPATCKILTFKKRLILFGDSKVLKNFAQGLITLRDPNIYTGTGIRSRTKTYITKPGKIRKR